MNKNNNKASDENEEKNSGGKVDGSRSDDRDKESRGKAGEKRPDKRETPPSGRSRSRLAKDDSSSQPSSHCSGDDEEADPENPWLMAPPQRKGKRKKERKEGNGKGVKVDEQTGKKEDKQVTSEKSSRESSVDSGKMRVTVDVERMELGELSLGKRKSDNLVGEGQFGSKVYRKDGKVETSKVLTTKQEKRAKKVENEEERRALVLRESGRNKGDDVTWEEGVSLERELGNIRERVKKVIVQNKQVPVEVAASLYGVIDRYEVVIRRMSVENERLEMKMEQQATETDRRMKDMEARMRKLEEGMEAKLFGMIGKVEEKLMGVCEGVMGRLEDGAGKSEAAGLVGRPTALPKSYALIVRGDKEQLTAMEVRKRIVETVGEEVPVKVRGMRTIRNGGVVVEAATEEDRKRLANCPLGDAGLRAAAPKRFDPRVIVYDVPSVVSDLTILDQLKRKI